jgi:hypothetical protein
MKISNFFKVTKYSTAKGTAAGEVKQVSKIKVGSFLVALAAIIGTVGGYLSGSIDFTSGLLALAGEIGVLLAVFGISEIPLLNTIVSTIENLKPTTSSRKR